ncbi:putative DNA primase/helicase [Paraburkholderia fungorum]|uniref:Putative DNA primase/helicase n=2 Tax=Paraburkholderia fungorum TaxID=134537 RepID=A0A1H1JXM5_9BURK|nr:putative DNA primase/helicase [Paraburkholderia fungorum]
MNASGRGLSPEKYEWLQRKLKEFRLSPEAWISTLMSYGIPADSLTGNGAPCPICGGDDRFTYDNRNGRGDWVCRQCNGGNPGAGDGLQLISKVSGIGLYRLICQLEGSAPRPLPAVCNEKAPKPKSKVDPAFVEKILNSTWENDCAPLEPGGFAMQYLAGRVPGLSVEPSKALRFGMLEYRDNDRSVLGTWPGIVARYVLPDGRLGTLHRTYLDHRVPKKAEIISASGEILDPKKNHITLNPLLGGAVRLMDPVDGEIGVGEGLESAYGAHMEFDVPVWYCLNKDLLRQFVVPHGLCIKVVHIFMDFDEIDPRTRKSPGVAAALQLAARLRADGYRVVLHRPKRRGHDFCTEWNELWQLRHKRSMQMQHRSVYSRQAIAAQ